MGEQYRSRQKEKKETTNCKGTSRVVLSQY